MMIGGHGHVVPRADGAKARCGGPSMCTQCAQEKALLEASTRAQVNTVRQIDGFSFSAALIHLKDGGRLARKGWNGRGMFVYLVPPASYPVQTGAAKAHFGEGSLVPYNAYMAIKNVDDTVSTWVPSVNDCLADDWFVVE